MPDGHVLTFHDGSEADLRLHVLEMTVACLAAQLPERSLEEVVSLLVFVAKGADSVAEVHPEVRGAIGSAGHHAAALLDRIAKARRVARRPAAASPGGAPEGDAPQGDAPQGDEEVSRAPGC
ncbi:hypothetical protein ACE7GA_05415 [Roseomonas sp. CCTCC AB2023176]|uniref:hypothetical protein n=1 Tax=Roseomonas sp. CCTCC AB2023176 TaxID=3342640 RepID=UPI0035E2BE54